MKEDEQQIRNVIQTWMSATKKGDIETVLGLMTDDVIFMIAGQEPFGKEAFEAATKQQQNMKIAGTSEIKEIKIIGDWAYTRTYIKIQITTKESGESVHRSGYTLSILRKESDGKWRLARDANMLTTEG